MKYIAHISFSTSEYLKAYSEMMASSWCELFTDNSATGVWVIFIMSTGASQGVGLSLDGSRPS